jgi:proline iminopeptidase
MKKILLFIFIVSFSACQKENVTLGTSVYETFFVQHKGASMPIHVSGNTASKVMLIFIPGGPGGPGLVYKTKDMEKIEEKYAIAYINQRECGISQGKSTEPNTMDLMTEDLEIMIETLKSRYGKDLSVFILGHSFGGMAVSAYVTKGNNQQTIKGWIDADGISDYAAIGNLTRDMYLKYGQQEIALGKKVAEWTPIVEWCKAHPNKLTSDEIQFINQQTDGEDLMDEYINPVDYGKQSTYFSTLSSKFDFPVVPYAINIFTTGALGSSLSKDIETKAYHQKMKNVTIPSLFLVGKYDFLCPPALHQDAFDNTASKDKKIVIFPKSGHQTYLNEPELFVKEVLDFMTKYK